MHHVSLSAALGERLTVGEWNEIAEKYVQRMGFEHSPCVVIRHIDTEHDHIVTSRIDAHGKVVSDFRSKARAEEFVRDIEEKYDQDEAQGHVDYALKENATATEFVHLPGESG